MLNKVKAVRTSTKKSIMKEDHWLMKMWESKYAILEMVAGLIFILRKEFKLDNIEGLK